MAKHFLLSILLVIGMAAALPAQMRPSGQTPTPRPDPAMQVFPSSVEENVVYATVGGQKLALDVYQPGGLAAEVHPAVVLLHGGAWSSGDKSTMKSMGAFLSRCGFVAFSVDYRLFHGNENLWPVQLDDVQRAVRWIRAHAGQYQVDPDHIGAFGHSAGAQLAALLGMEDTRDNSDHALAKYSSKVQAVVDVSGPTDFAPRDPEGDAFMASFFGGDYEKHKDTWRDASPVTHAAKGDAPFLIVQGTHDESVPMAQAQALADKLKQAGVPVKFVTVDDGHTFETPEARKRLALESQAFFTEYLRPGN